MTKIKLTQNALRVLEARYLQRDANGCIVETPEQLFESVARAVAEAERHFGDAEHVQYWQDRFHKLITSLDFLPNSPTLMNAGKPIGQLSACFVLPVEDTIGGIFDAVKQMALVQRTGGGTGFSFSRLRPKGDLVASTSGEASGPVSFMKVFDCATENIKQGGKRRGANMGVLRVDHPDILDFVTAKLDGKTLRNFNISVAVTDDFIKAVENDSLYELVHPNNPNKRHRVRAAEIFDAITKAAWQTGDPGLLFIDTINRFNPTPHLGEIEATNPCGEVPLLPYESCNLGSINLAHMLHDQNGKAVIHWSKLRNTVHEAVRFLDDVLEVSKYPICQIRKMTLGNRKIGLGVMGFAEMLIRLGISYDSDDAVRTAENIMRFISQEALYASQQLAEQRGEFPNWNGSIYENKNIKVRNATRTAIAPTGTIGIIAGTSSGIEPLFALAYRRSHVLEGQTLIEVNPLFLEYLDRYRLKADEVVEEVLKHGRLKSVQNAPEPLKQLFVTALEIPPERNLKIQAALQSSVDNSVSKTINLPRDSTPQDIARIYLRAWHMGLKGITVYRYGSKDIQVLELGTGENIHHFEHASRCDPEECNI
ncbi:MAG: adenosylcobalamin-dependent ribonucleoside-diphosphate reductase [Deltaproteobacteria bacterium]|nr:adenosylcobalamin-dependent ribonucleoside-diphosphate reductase [Deltaproteobacteria bacterium]